jgi:hypothetical protein
MTKRFGLDWYQPIAILIVALLPTGYVWGADDPAAKIFVNKIVAAINRDDNDARKSLMHPDALSCDQALKRAMAEGAFAPRQGPIPTAYRWRISAMPNGTAGWFPDKFDYPVLPTHQLHIDFQTAPNKTEGIMLQIVRYRNEWREITGCPKESTIIEARHAAKTRGQQEERIQSLTTSIAPKLKEEIMRHLADGRKIDAIIHFRNMTNEELAVAKGVVEQLMQQAETRSDKK